ncbi:MAG: FAD:protein FMN transferase [Candidatus Cloacimonetes bacterium]|nr:FAD:protein FMN transferase [Candidatus Cloacimonadota bacterium]
MTRKEIISLLILILIVSYGAYKYINREFSEIRSKYILDTILEISATSKSKQVGSEIEAVLNYIKELEDKLNEFDDNSLIYRINNSEMEEFPMDDDLYSLLQLADSLWQLTQGSYDPTIKPVWDLWNFNSEYPVVPDSLVLKTTLEKVDFSKINYTKKKLYKPKEMQLTFGALTKGYILDKALSNMKSRGLYRGFINSRSSMAFYGFKIAPLVYIQHPRKPDDSIASFRINNLSVGTSGDYQQYFELQNKRYHHILNAHTGKPVDGVFSVTVVSDNTAFADGLSTALFTMNPDEALELVSKMPQTNCVIYCKQNDAIVSLKTAGIRMLEFSEKL